jgi:hypothetical protein
VLDGLKEHYNMLPYARGNLVSGIKGYYSGSGKESLIVLPVEQPWMIEILERHTPTRSALSVVKNEVVSNTGTGEADAKLI